MAQLFAKIVDRYSYTYHILVRLVISDFKLRYQGSILGYLWSFLKPLSIFVILYLVFIRFLKFDFGVEYPALHLLLGIILWGFFLEVTNTSVAILVNYGDLIRKINFPKYVLLLSASLSALINLSINLLIVAIFMAILGTGISPSILLFPLILAQLYLLSLACGFLLSAAYVRFRDIGHIWESTTQALFFLIPLFYPPAFLPENIAKWFMLNPLSQIIQDGRYLLLSPEVAKSPQNPESVFITADFFDNLLVLTPYLLTVVFFIFSALYFRRKSVKFAEKI